jgi:phospholipase/carboxylesterase
MLEHELHLPGGARDGAPLLVLLHGRGADRFDLLELGPLLAPGAVVVTPQAPFPGLPWGYGPGWAWYRFLGRDRPEP